MSQSLTREMRKRSEDTEKILLANGAILAAPLVIFEVAPAAIYYGGSTLTAGGRIALTTGRCAWGRARFYYNTFGRYGGIENGILIKGDKSWSIDMQRYNFQFTGQQFHQIKNGKIVGQLKDVAYQATTTDFWGSMIAVGGPSTYVLGGAFNCGKGQPGQVAAVSHGCPAAVFQNINVLNTVAEAGA